MIKERSLSLSIENIGIDKNARKQRLMLWGDCEKKRNR